MKRNYIAPNTEMINLGSNGIMQSLQIKTGSSASFSEATEID